MPRKSTHVSGTSFQNEDITESKLTEEKLLESENRFRALIEYSSDAVALVASDGTFSYVSPTVKKILGYTPEELIGRSSLEVFPSEELESSLKKFSKVVKNPGSTVVVQHKAVHKNGSIRWLESKTTNRLNNPTIHAFISNFRDITERRKAEATQSRLAAIVASSNDAIISKNLDGIITSWNNAAKKMFGYTAKEAIGKHISIIIPPEFREEEEVIISNLRKGKHIDCETTRLRKDGKIFFVSLTISPIKDKEGNIIGASKIARDISLRKQAEKKQQFLNKMSDLLTNSIDLHITFTAIVKLIVPALADYCRIAVVDEKNQQELA